MKIMNCLVDIKVGELLFVDARSSFSISRISPVNRVMKRFIELKDGTKCDFNGSIYPSDTWNRINVRKVQEEDYAVVFRQKALYKISIWKPHEADDETLARVYDALRNIPRKPRKKK